MSVFTHSNVVKKFVAFILKKKIQNNRFNKISQKLSVVAWEPLALVGRKKKVENLFNLSTFSAGKSLESYNIESKLDPTKYVSFEKLDMSLLQNDGIDRIRSGIKILSFHQNRPPKIFHNFMEWSRNNHCHRLNWVFRLQSNHTRSKVYRKCGICVLSKNKRKMTKCKNYFN